MTNVHAAALHPARGYVLCPLSGTMVNPVAATADNSKRDVPAFAGGPMHIRPASVHRPRLIRAH